MLMRFDPFGQVERLTQQLDAAGRVPPMPMDAYRHDDQLVVHLDLPGVEPEAIEVNVENNVLTVQAQRQIARGEGEEWLVAERPQGRFSRQLFLSENLDTDAIEAHYDQGVLTLSVPVAEAAKPRKVEVARGHRQALDTGPNAA